MAYDLHTFPEIAALLATLLRNLNKGGKDHGSFEEQLSKSLSELGPQNAGLRKSLEAISALHGKAPELFDNAHREIAKLLTALEKDAGEKWSGCNFISQNQILRIADLK